MPLFSLLNTQGYFSLPPASIHIDSFSLSHSSLFSAVFLFPPFISLHPLMLSPSLSFPIISSLCLSPLFLVSFPFILSVSLSPPPPSSSPPPLFLFFLLGSPFYFSPAPQLPFPSLCQVLFSICFCFSFPLGPAETLLGFHCLPLPLLPKVSFLSSLSPPGFALFLSPRVY